MTETTRHRLETGIEVEFERLDGVVVDQREQAVTSVSQGTQWYMDGSSSPGQITSSTGTMRTAWLRDASGREHHFDFSELAVEARAGHQLTLVLGAAVGVERQLLAVFNHTTQMVHSRRVGGVDSANNDFARRLFFPGKFKREWKMFAAAGSVALLLAVITDPHGGLYQDLQVIFFGGILGSVVWVFALLFRLSPARRLELRTYPEIERQAEQLAQSA